MVSKCFFLVCWVTLMGQCLPGVGQYAVCIISDIKEVIFNCIVLRLGTSVRVMDPIKFKPK